MSSRNTRPRTPSARRAIGLRILAVAANLAAEGTQLKVDLKGTTNPARVVKAPFYKRAQ